MSRRHAVIAAVSVALCAGAALLYTPDRDRAQLEARYLARPSDVRMVDGVSLHVRDSGPRGAPTLVLLHGLGASLHTWEPWARALETQYRVVRFDFPGHGLSGAPLDNDYSDARSRRLLVALLDSLGVPRATLVGNSMGGRIAWSFAAEHPERMEKLVLIAPDGFESPGFAYDKPAEVPAVLGAMRWVLPRAMLVANLAPAYAQPSRLTDSTATRYYDLMLAPGNRERLLQRMQQTVLTDPIPRLRRITAPTLLLWGAQDQMIPVSNAQDYLAAIPGATLVTLPGLGHLPFEEAPQQALPALLNFLNGP
ncbi:alpha/beta hydrolase [Gemmatimonas sp.]|uniref:alpha/beta fold hydrolase n=1 Tax=Gemmatimonas sp. TaxID=1962908 RepID=UPI00333F8BF8